MYIETNKQLKHYTTFGIEATAEQFIAIHDGAQLAEVLQSLSGKPLSILGGGSNILVTRDIPGTVLHIALIGIEIVAETNEHVLVRCMAGELWDDLVGWCVERGYSGLENLSAIPGTVGAAPMQNIGAYGVEQEKCFVELSALEIATGNTKLFTKEECVFGYRESVFKHKYQYKFIITSVTYRLNKQPIINAEYKDIQQEFATRNITNPTIADVRSIVTAIRARKLPNPKEIGNAGSFFKNPVISKEKAEQLAEVCESIPLYPIDEHHVKVAAAWLIDQCGYKGYRQGDAGVHVNQALVLVNYGNAQGHDILELSLQIKESVFNQFGITLEREVNVW